ncbi:HTH-type transcriptional regulator RutR [Labrys wisconsinensis]|uniref:TetR/AcrR family transcriptional regulator n=1 Tax=Labrys wisconsinensis TaxID=425677 RepID=A0ABU0J697_9HYPH|nr:HTH-type transcriptional regulator RutR [Labrys wisconsinensis]MDQ0469759.1 TetR/AcrR family transcriptional regulator [Labrys wisconsinensis]
MADGDAAATARPKTRIGAANIDRILDAALTAFAGHGLRGTRIEQIAEAAGMSKTNLLYYFRSKDDLYRAVLTRMLDIWLKPLRELDAARGPEASLTAYIEQKLEHSRRFPEASRLFAIEIMQGAPHLSHVLETELAELVDRKIGIVNGWIAEGRLAPMDPRHLLFMIWATTQHYADFATQIRALTGKGLEDEAFFGETRQAVVGVILRGVLTR